MGVADAVQNRLRILQLFRHEAAHLVAALQAYMQGQVLGACWHHLQTVVLVSCKKVLTAGGPGPMPGECPLGLHAACVSACDRTNAMRQTTCRCF